MSIIDASKQADQEKRGFEKSWLDSICYTFCHPFSILIVSIHKISTETESESGVVKYLLLLLIFSAKQEFSEKHLKIKVIGT